MRVGIRFDGTESGCGAFKDTVVEAFKGLAKGLGAETAWEVAEKEFGLRDSIDWTKVGEAGVHKAISNAVTAETKKALKEVGVDAHHSWNPLTSTHKDGHTKDDSSSEHSDGSKSDSHDKSTHDHNKKDENKSDEDKKKEKKYDTKVGHIGDKIADQAADAPDSNKKRLLKDLLKLHQNSTQTAGTQQTPSNQSSLNLPPI